MEKDIQKLTQNERYDLKRKQVMEEMEAYNSKFSDWYQVFGFDQKKLMEEYYRDIAINSDEYKNLKAENERLKEQLNDYEKALEKYADEKNWNEDLGGNYNFHYKEKYRPKTFEGFLECVFDCPIAPTIYNGLSLAKETLKKWEDK